MFYPIQYQQHRDMKQKQQQAQINNQILTQFYVYQDLQNFINLLYSLKVVNEYFKGQNDHPMVKICRNKVILQMNLSNGIHYDLESQKESAKILKEEKIKVAKLLSQVESDLKDFKNYIDWYKNNCLSQNIQLQQQNLEVTQMVTNFNQNVLQQIIPAINSMDEQVKNLQGQQSFIAPTIQEIKEKALKYQDYTRESLGKNPHIQTTQIQQNKNQEIIKDKTEIFSVYQKQILKNFKQFEPKEKEQYEKIKLYINVNKGNLEQEHKHAIGLYNKSQIKEYHPQYFKFYLFEQFIKFSQTNNFKIDPKANEFLKFLETKQNGKEQKMEQHFLKYLYQKPQFKIEDTSFCDYYKNLYQSKLNEL